MNLGLGKKPPEDFALALQEITTLLPSEIWSLREASSTKPPLNLVAKILTMPYTSHIVSLQMSYTTQSDTS